MAKFYYVYKVMSDLDLISLFFGIVTCYLMFIEVYQGVMLVDDITILIKDYFMDNLYFF